MSNYDWMKTYGTQNITCPYCGHVEEDSWDVEPGESEFDLDDYECIECEEKFPVSRVCRITYNSRKRDGDAS